MVNIPVLYKRKEDCCGCGACLNACPKSAITMVEDECGFLYPSIDSDRCIRCEKCKQVCAFQTKNEENIPLKCYAAVNKNHVQLQKSASGGVFSAISSAVVDNGGIVYGVVLDEKWDVYHISASISDELKKLQGSKYVQSDTRKSFGDARKQLDLGKTVLFSGTPCQIAGLKSFLNKDYDNLYTIDLVCHGVPSNKLFKDYIASVENKYKGKASDFIFRDKTLGWGINSSVYVAGKKIRLWKSASSYLYNFQKGTMYRESCYTCKYACEHRPGDITIGDFWGIETQHPDYIGLHKWDEREGISCVIINSNKGHRLIDKFGNKIELKLSSFDRISHANGQLVHPSRKISEQGILRDYIVGGWDNVETKFNQGCKLKFYSSMIKFYTPRFVKRLLKQLKALT